MNTYRTHRHRCGMNNLFKRIGMMSLAVSLLAACATDDDVPGSSVKQTDRDEYTLNLTLSAGALASRIGTEIYEGTEAEHLVNIAQDDYAVFIFDQAGNFMQRFEPGAVSLKQGGTSAQYVINGAFQPSEDVTDIQLMVLTNWQTDFGGNYHQFENDATDIASIYDNTPACHITLPETTSPEASWVPSSTSGIPMFGLSESIALSAATPAGLLNFNTIPMLRSLAKIEIVDKVKDGEAPTGGAHITKCELTSYNKNGRLIPNEATYDTWQKNWNPNQPVKPDDESLAEPKGADIVRGINLPFVSTQVKIDNISYNSHVVYVPEMSLPMDGNRPVINVYVENEATPSYTIHLCDYQETPIEGTEYTSLLRNHIYRYNVTGIGISAELTLLIETPNWDVDDDEYTYEDIPQKPFSGEEGHEFAWEWNEENKDINEVILAEQEEDRRNIVVSRDLEGVATFTITAPERGSWTISLSADEVTPNHWFRIDLWDAENEEWIISDGPLDEQGYVIADTQSGKIAAKGETPTEVKIRVVANDLQYTGNPYSAKVVMNVTTFDGRMAEVNLTTGELMNDPDDDKNYYKIKQYPTATE